MEGIEVFNADGTIQFSTANRLARVIATFNTSGNTGTIAVPGMDTGEPFAVASIAATSNTQFNTFPCTVTINKAGGTVSWSISGFQRPSTITVCVF